MSVSPSAAIKAQVLKVMMRDCMHNTGESYSGVYVPLLGKAIINGNEDGASPYIHLEVCNACKSA